MSDDDRDNDIESDADKRAHHNALERKRRDHIKDSFTMLRDSLPFFQGDKVRVLQGSGHNDATKMQVPAKKRGSTVSNGRPSKTSRKEHRKIQASRAQILKKAADYIQSMRRKNTAHQQDIDDLKKQNRHLEDQIRSLEKAKATGNYAAAAAVIEASHLANSKASSASFDADSDSEDSSDISDESKDSPRKRLKSTSDVPLRT